MKLIILLLFISFGPCCFAQKLTDHTRNRFRAHEKDQAIKDQEEEALKLFDRFSDPEHDISLYNWDGASKATDCPPECTKVLGNGICDAACNLGKCFHDLNDCKVRNDNICHSGKCPDDGVCRPHCEVNSCTSNPVCKPEDREFQQYAVVTAPIPPHRLFERFELVESKINNLTGLTVRLLSSKFAPLIFGFRKGSTTSEQVNVDRKTFEPVMQLDRSEYEKKSMIVFVLETKNMISYENKTVVDALATLGTGKLKGTIGLYPIWRDDAWKYSPSWVHVFREIQRMAREKYEQSRGRAKREALMLDDFMF